LEGDEDERQNGDAIVEPTIKAIETMIGLGVLCISPQKGSIQDFESTQE